MLLGGIGAIGRGAGRPAICVIVRLLRPLDQPDDGASRGGGRMDPKGYPRIAGITSRP
jgi:hypothetical protein